MNITILFKPVSDACNLYCTYCYYDEGRLVKKRISLEKVEESIKKLNSLDDDDKINFIWHGGEPLLVGHKYFSKVIELQNKILSSKSVRNGIQTNGVLINKNWIEIFKKNEMHVGISLDGSETVHNQNRLDRNSKGTFRRVMNAIDHLKNENVPFGVLSTVNNASLGNETEIFDCYIRNDIYRFDFKPCLSGDFSFESGITPKEWGGFMINMFDIWFDTDNPKVKIRFFEEIIKVVLGGKATLCSLSGGCSKIYTIDNRGHLYACDNVNPNDNRIVFSSNNLKTIVNTEGVLDAKRKEYINIANCNKCEFQYICNSYCPRYYDLGVSLCHGLKMIFSHITKRIQCFV